MKISETKVWIIGFALVIAAVIGFGVYKGAKHNLAAPDCARYSECTGK